MTTDRNDMAYWFPRLQTVGVPVPRTELVPAGCDLTPLLDGSTPLGWDDFLARLRAAAERIGYPVFLRTGHISGKHRWRHTCFVPVPEVLPRHVFALVEHSHLVDLFGLPTGTWAVREFLDLDARFSAFEGMPVAREFRVFLRGGNPNAVCSHPYWPPEAVAEGRPSRPDWRPILDAMNVLDWPAAPIIFGLVAQIAPHFDGAWSLDMARCRDGRWVVTDMAEADRSWHWPGCPNISDLVPPSMTR